MSAQTGYVIGAQAAITIEVDEYGDVTLRQGKATITVSANNLAGLIDILIGIDDGPGSGYSGGHRVDWSKFDTGAAIPESLDSPPTVPTKQPMAKAPMSNAERQRRYRESKRNGGTVTRVTKRNAKRNDRNARNADTVTEASELFPDTDSKAVK